MAVCDRNRDRDQAIPVAVVAFVAVDDVVSLSSGLVRSEVGEVM